MMVTQHGPQGDDSAPGTCEAQLVWELKPGATLVTWGACSPSNGPHKANSEQYFHFSPCFVNAKILFRCLKVTERRLT